LLVFSLPGALFSKHFLSCRENSVPVPATSRLSGTLAVIAKKMNDDDKIKFETKLGNKQFVDAFFRSLIIIVPAIFLCLKTYSVKALFFTLMLVFTSITIFAVLRSLKTFQIGDKFLIVKRPYLRSEFFRIQQIEKIIFYSYRFGKGKSYSIKIISKNGENEFSLTYFGEELKAFISGLKKAGIEVENYVETNSYNR
jgi:hypothetical protein